ncbi:hypothetical protein ACFV2N_08075 [Streptomyces sp. NPDC059680]|uniref:hypothetical protein n=1 Tax=Streptomyces TaxID=1883 RepID=UPI001E622511|nr:hypothetical protein [Streptomyces barringtoniae]MCC5476485.1 hypothetical protein [Streptomyces barringtoniae]
MKIIAKAVAGTLLAAAAVMAPLSMEAAAAPAAASVTAVAPSFHPGHHHAYGYRHAGDWRRDCDDDRYDRWRHRNHCHDDDYYGWDWCRYGNHHRAPYWDRD